MLWHQPTGKGLYQNELPQPLGPVEIGGESGLNLLLRQPPSKLLNEKARFIEARIENYSRCITPFSFGSKPMGHIVS